MERIRFTCCSCGKTIRVDPEIYRRIYQGHEYCLSCRGPPKKENDGQVIIGEAAVRLYI